jgi:hypothetical protein
MAFSSFRFLLAFVLAVCAPVLASAQALPWQNSASPSAAPPPPDTAMPWQNGSSGSSSHHHHKSSHQAATQPPANAANRKVDDRELDKLAARFYGIHSTDKDGVEKLKSLEGKVHKFRTVLPSRGYDATDIIADAKKLEGRISHQRKEWENKASAANGNAGAPATSGVTPASTPSSSEPSSPQPQPLPPLPGRPSRISPAAH